LAGADGRLELGRFSAPERRALLDTPLVGPKVVQRLEEVGLGGFGRLRTHEPAAVGLRMTF
jgi:hypothetical protein